MKEDMELKNAKNLVRSPTLLEASETSPVLMIYYRNVLQCLAMLGQTIVSNQDYPEYKYLDSNCWNHLP